MTVRPRRTKRQARDDEDDAYFNNDSDGEDAASAAAAAASSSSSPGAKIAAWDPPARPLRSPLAAEDDDALPAPLSKKRRSEGEGEAAGRKPAT